MKRVNKVKKANKIHFALISSIHRNKMHIHLNNLDVLNRAIYICTLNTKLNIMTTTLNILFTTLIVSVLLLGVSLIFRNIVLFGISEMVALTTIIILIILNNKNK